MKRVIVTLALLILGTVLFQGFQCASPEFQSAKLYYNQKEFEKAKESVEKELSKKPSNGEAWLLLCQIESQLNNYLEAATALEKAKENINLKIEKNKQDVALAELVVWTKLYGVGSAKVSRYADDQSDKSLITSAIEHVEKASKIRPYYPEIWRVLGIAYGLNEQTDKKYQAYANYAKILDKEIKFAKSKGLYIGMTRSDVIAFFGQSKFQEGSANESGDTLYTDLFITNEGRLFVFTRSPQENLNFKVIGWSYNPPQYWHPNIQKQPRNLYTDALLELANHLFENNDYDKSLSIISDIIQIDPQNTTAINFMIRIYNELDKKEEAIKFIETLLKKFPENENYLMQYGTILAKSGKYDEAIEAYEKALVINENMPEVLRNLGVSYKNRAVEIQEAQEQLEKDEQKPRNPEEYRPLLQKSAVNFEKALRTDKYKNDYTILADLADLYYVLEQEEALISTVKKMQALENTVAPQNKLDYYQKMLKIYDRAERNYKNKEFFDTFPTQLKIIQKKMKALE